MFKIFIKLFLIVMGTYLLLGLGPVGWIFLSFVILLTIYPLIKDKLEN